MTNERRMAIAGAVLIVLAAAALSGVNYVEGAAFWALVGAGIACFVVGICLYGYTIRVQFKRRQK